MTQKSTRKKSTESSRRDYRVPGIVQNRSRNQDRPGRESLILQRLKISLGHLVTHLSTSKKIGRKRACEDIAERLSALAGLNNGHVWGWKYIAAICSGSLAPSQKFIRVFNLYDQHLKPRKKQWFYFANRKQVAAVYDKSIRKEIIQRHFKEMGYRAVTYSRYAEIKPRRSS